MNSYVDRNMELLCYAHTNPIYLNSVYDKLPIKKVSIIANEYYDLSHFVKVASFFNFELNLTIKKCTAAQAKVQLIQNMTEDIGIIYNPEAYLFQCDKVLDHLKDFDFIYPTEYFDSKLSEQANLSCTIFKKQEGIYDLEPIKEMKSNEDAAILKYLGKGMWFNTFRVHTPLRHLIRFGEMDDYQFTQKCRAFS